MPSETPSSPAPRSPSTAEERALARKRRRSRIVAGIVVVVGVAALVWASDRITLQGERTIYTVECTSGAWDGNRCTGLLAAGPRYAFRASPRRNEVIYWIRGSGAPSGKFSDCMVRNRDNWSCNVEVNKTPALTYELKDGKPTHGTAGLTMTFHAVPKWKWFAIDAGFGRLFSTAGD